MSGVVRDEMRKGEMKNIKTCLGQIGEEDEKSRCIRREKI